MQAVLQDLMAWANTSDEEYSEKIFQSSLPKPVEGLFSLPANWFGLWHMSLIGPLWIGLIFDANSRSNLPLLGITFFLTTILLFAWASFLFGNLAMGKKVFGGKTMYLVGPIISLSLCYSLIEDAELFSISVYPLCLWIPSLMVVLTIKRMTGRTRPCAKEKYQRYISRKNFPFIPRLLAKVSTHASFPSGDAAGAMAIGIPVALLGKPLLGGLIMFLACTGRVYFLVHHVFDTIVGSLVPLGVHYFATEALDYTITSLTWREPAMLMVLLLVFALTFGKDPRT